MGYIRLRQRCYVCFRSLRISQFLFTFAPLYLWERVLLLRPDVPLSCVWDPETSSEWRTVSSLFKGADLRTNGAKRVRIANRLSTLLRSNMFETLWAQSKSKTRLGWVFYVFARSVSDVAIKLNRVILRSASRGCKRQRIRFSRARSQSKNLITLRSFASLKMTSFAVWLESPTYRFNNGECHYNIIGLINSTYILRA